jgi:eukaryotic-like serine/threonine-protein kinase
MHCQSCGTVLQPGAAACPSCGTPVPSAPSDFSLYESSTDTVPYIPYASAVETSPVSSSQPSPPHARPYTHPPSYTSSQFNLGAPPFAEHSIQEPPGVLEQLPPSQQQRGGLSAAMVALLIILALLLAAAGSGLAYYLIAIRPAQHQAQATTVAPTISLTQTAANAQQTTPLTATNPQDLYTQTTSGTPALTDPLSPQNPNQWYPISGSTGTCTFTGKALHASNSHTGSKGIGSACEARLTSFDNFAYQARVTILQGDIGGLAFRIDDPGQKVYIFTIQSDGLYTLGSTSGHNAKLLAAANSSSINTGLNQSNLLTVIARGSMIYLYVNQQYLTSISDSTSSSGEIGVSAVNTSGGHVDVAFSAIQVWKL